jgi:alpha-L-fucosidase 2
MKLVLGLLASLAFLVISLGGSSCKKGPDSYHPLTLWYEQPAAEWTEALPVGNGRLGAMVYGKTGVEQIQLNEESLWAGSKINNNNPGALTHLEEIRRLLLGGDIVKALDLSNKYLLGTPPRIRSYQTLGDLFIDTGTDTSGIKGYRRELDLRTGIVRTEYEKGNARYTREVFASSPDDVIVMLLRTEKGKLNVRITLKRERDANVTADNGSLVMTGQVMDKDSPESGPGGVHMQFAARLEARPEDGNVSTSGDTLIVQGTSSLLLMFTAATDYNREKLDCDRGINPLSVCKNILDKAEAKTYRQMLADHVQDHQRLFNRVDFRICGLEADTIPTDRRLNNVINGAEDKHLDELYFQYGRYLLMGSSRAPGVLPANLQGIWNNYYEAPWNSDYHTNINLQMNYWPADVCNLPETMDPLTGFMQQITLPGKVTAADMYGCRGWTMHHNTDPYGRTGLMDGIQWGTFPMAGPWMALHFWEHFSFTADTAWLRSRAWPVLKGSAQFVLGFLVEDGSGQLVTAPSYSPENAYFLPGTNKPMQLTYGATMDIQIARELFKVCIKAAELVGEHPAFADSLRSAMEKLPPTRIGKDGTIMEWIADYEEAEPGHRHVSHLFGLHPGTQITRETPELFEAARKTIERRLVHGGGHTGWSRAWIINFYARLHDGERAHDHLMALLGKSTLENLFDTHPPFQIDGNFGGTAGIAEMLLQSHEGFIDILPALPPSWEEGSIKGLRARGNYEVNMSWKDGHLQQLTIKAFSSQLCRVRYGKDSFEFNAEKGRSYTFGPGLERR